MSHQIQIANSDATFICNDEQSLLDAGLKAGIEMPYSCRKGVCGNCAGKIVQGEVTGIKGAAIRNEMCTPEQVLFCMCTATSGLLIEPQSWQRIDPNARKRITAKVFRNQLVAPDVSLLQLRLPPGQRAKFKAGQYMQVQLEDGSTRSYSMANPPQESDAITLHIRHVPGGRFTAVAPTLKTGDLLDIEVPFGSFSLQEQTTRPIVCVVGGTGFAPIKSILDDMVKRRIHRPVTLIWGARNADGLYLLSAVERWQRQLPGFRFVPALSEDFVSTLEGIYAGPVHEAMLAHCDTLIDHELYCCGSPGMVAAVREAAVNQRGLAVADFHSDVFVEGGAAS